MSTGCHSPVAQPTRSRDQFVVALAGNPNTGKSTVFNRLTGLRQHTGNWAGKTVARAEGEFQIGAARFRLIDLPGTYSLLSTSQDEEIARDFILFESPDVTVVVVDATCLERNLNLVLQVLEITDRAVVCLNLMDEAHRLGLKIDVPALENELGVPVAPTSARSGEGMALLVQRIREVAEGRIAPVPQRMRQLPPRLSEAVQETEAKLLAMMPRLSNVRWIALRLLEGDARIEDGIRSGRLADGHIPNEDDLTSLLAIVAHRRGAVAQGLHDQLAVALHDRATFIFRKAAGDGAGARGFRIGRTIDRLVTSRLFGLPLMILMLGIVFWITIAGANVPSQMISELLIDRGKPLLSHLALLLHAPDWLRGLLIDGVYLASAWVIAVMLPPMAIFFPLFTILEDLGYLPRVAFNLDRFFKSVGAHGKQALTMCMGFGCNAAGVVAARIIDSPRERLIAIITNNFSLCNGRWPTQILLATIFIGGLASPLFAGFAAAGAVAFVAVLGVALALITSLLLSRTFLRGEASSFTLELPPNRPPKVWQVLYTSLIDRTIFVLWRAVVFAVPAGAAIWLIANIRVGDQAVATWLIGLLDPIGLAVGLNGVILLAYIVAIPANEIVVPTILMLSVLAGGGQADTMFELESLVETEALLRANGWTLLTAVNLMLFSLIHNPCSTTIYTIYKETGSARWTLVASVGPVLLGLAVCWANTSFWRMLGFN